MIARMLESFSWKGVAAFFLFAVALSAWTWSGVLLVDKDHTFSEHAEYLLSLLQRNLLSFFPVYLAVAMTDGLTRGVRHRRWYLAGALTLGVLLAVQVRCAVTPNTMYWVYATVQLPFCTTFPTWRTYFDFPGTFITPFTIGGMVMILVFGRRRDAELAAALHKVRTTQLEARRSRIEADLAAMHARVDPDKLSATLRGIRVRYDENLEAGEAMLDALIADLREAAQPPPAQQPS
jgi:hypothetical protein